MRKLLTFSAFAAAFIGASLFLTSTVHAANCTWTGASPNNMGLGQANWSDAANWSGCAGNAPTTGDDLFFPAGAIWTINNDDLAYLEVSSINFPDTQSYTLNGTGTLAISNGIYADNGWHYLNISNIQIAQDNVAILTAPLATIDFSNNLSLLNHSVMLTTTAGGGSGVRFFGSITGSSGAVINKAGTGNALLSIDDAGSQRFDINISAGSISTNALAQTFLPYSGYINLTSGTHLYLNDSSVTGAITGSGTVHTSRGFHQVRFQTDSTFTGDFICDVNGACTTLDQIVFLGSVSSTYTLDRSGGSLSYSGKFDINTNANVLLMDTNFAYAAKTIITGTLIMDGSLLGDVQVGFSTYPGRLWFQGANGNSITNLTSLNASTIGSFIVDTSNYGKVNVLSTPNISTDTVFTVQGTYIPNTGDVFTIINNVNGGAPVNHPFFGLAQGGNISLNGGTLTADYQAIGNTEFRLSANSPVINNNPVINDFGSLDAAVVEGQTYNFFVDIYDVDSGDTHTVTIDWGDGSSNTINNASLVNTGNQFAGNTIWEATRTHIYADNGNYTISVTINDNNSGNVSDTYSQVVDNIAPTLPIITVSSYLINTGGSITIDATILDPGILDSFSFNINWGDGSAISTAEVAGVTNMTQRSHTYSTAGTYQITIRITDKDSGYTEYLTNSIIVGDSEVSLIPSDSTLFEGDSVTLIATYTGTTLTGTNVTFADSDGNPICTDTLDINGQAFCVITNLQVGTFTYTVSVEGFSGEFEQIYTNATSIEVVQQAEEDPVDIIDVPEVPLSNTGTDVPFGLLGFVMVICLIAALKINLTNRLYE